MSDTNLELTFKRLAAKDEKALVAYMTAGDPDLETSAKVLDTLCLAGADVIELGVPFSDPMADGPTLQRAATRALRAGTTLARVLDMVRVMRRTHLQPVILFGYYNPFLQYGLDRLAKDAAEAGVDGFLVVDLPPEEAGPFREAIAPHGLHLIPLVAPTSTPERIESLRGEATGFVYYVSRTGVTGVGGVDVLGVTEAVTNLKATLSVPVCVGFGVSRPDQVRAIGTAAEGVVVGSAIQEVVERLGQGAADLAQLEALVRGLKAPLVPQLH